MSGPGSRADFRYVLSATKGRSTPQRRSSTIVTYPGAVRFSGSHLHDRGLRRSGAGEAVACARTNQGFDGRPHVAHPRVYFSLS
jgi:hypothetical protein